MTNRVFAVGVLRQRVSESFEVEKQARIGLVRLTVNGKQLRAAWLRWRLSRALTIHQCRRQQQAHSGRNLNGRDHDVR